jgi:hypothetical protein
MSDPLMITGKLTKGDAKKLTDTMRGSTVGPTTLYYAGVTAPVIGAGMALVAQEAFHMINLGDYWETMLSAIVAAMAGITWYLIFMRWSYRHRHGRSGEMEIVSKVTLADGWIAIRRGKVETRIDWSAVTEIKEAGSYTLVKFDGTDPLMLPNKWFGRDKSARTAFIERLKQGKVT